LRANDILFWQEQIPSHGNFDRISHRRPILVIDDLRELKRRTEHAKETVSGEFGENLDLLLTRLAEASGLHQDSINVIITVWPDDLDWLKEELEGLDFQFVDVSLPTREEKLAYLRAIAPSFPSLTLSPETIEELVQCHTYRNIFECLQSFKSRNCLCPTPVEAERERGSDWAEQLKGFPPAERLLFYILTTLYQFGLPAQPVLVEAIYAESLRGNLSGRLAFRVDRPLIRRLLHKLSRFDWYCDRAFDRAVQSLRTKTCLGVGDLLNCDQPDALAAPPGDPVYLEELNAIVEILQSHSAGSRPLQARKYWVPLLMQAGELLHKEGLYQQAIDQNNWLLQLKPERLPEPVNETRSKILHYIGFNVYSQDNLDPQAANYYRKAIDEDPANVKALHSLASVNLHLSRYDEAIPLLHRILEYKPNDDYALITVIGLYLRHRASWSEVEGSYNRLASTWRTERNVGLAGSIGVALARVDAARAIESRESTGESQFRHVMENVRREFERAIQLSAPQRAAFAHFYYGSFLLDTANDPDSGTAQLELAIRTLRDSYVRHSASGHRFMLTLLRKLASCYESHIASRPTEAASLSGKLDGLTKDIARLLANTEPGDTIDELKSHLQDNPKQWSDWWLLGRAYEAKYMLQESFDAFWNAAEGFSLATLFSQLRSIVDAWCEPSSPGPPFPPPVRITGMKWSARLHEYHFDVLEHEIPTAADLIRFQELPCYARLARFMSECQRLRGALLAAGWPRKTIGERKMQCSARAFTLDPEGVLSLKNIADYAVDLEENQLFKQAFPLFKKQCDLEWRSGGRPCFALWQLGLCSKGIAGVITRESAGYFMESAALENTLNVMIQLYFMLRDAPLEGEILANLALDVYGKGPAYASPLLIRYLAKVCLERVWKSRRYVAAQTVGRIVQFEHHHPAPEAAAMTAVTLQRNRQEALALPYFERLLDIGHLPMYILFSYKACLERLHHGGAGAVAKILDDRRAAQVGFEL
jgi:cytochrome c-type biogenesis protein CcmH/NrfG